MAVEPEVYFYLCCMVFSLAYGLFTRNSLTGLIVTTVSLVL